MNEGIVRKKTIDERIGSFIEIKRIVFQKQTEKRSRKKDGFFTEPSNFQKESEVQGKTVKNRFLKILKMIANVMEKQMGLISAILL